MGKIISLVNQKGGVGKTTTTVNIAASLAHFGQRVLLIDNDPQGNSTTGIGVEKSDLEYSIYDVLVAEMDAKEVIVKSQIKNLDLLPSKIDLASADVELARVPYREKRLVNGLRNVRDDYDYILIDCPPSLGLLTLNALNACDSVIVPVQCEYYALEGLTQLLSTILRVQKNMNQSLMIEGVILTMLDRRTNLGIEVIEEVRKYFKEKVYNTIIPRMVKLSEAPAHGLPIIKYDPSSKGTKAYLNLTEEILKNNEKN